MFRTPLIHKHRAVARAALYAAPVFLVLGILGVIRILPKSVLDGEQSWLSVDWEEYESVRLFQEYLWIDTSYPDGNEIPGAEFLARELTAAGIEVHLERLGARNANLWAILEGEDPRALVLHNHIDVDPVPHRERWKQDPFGGEIKPPWIFGRGAFDMKSVTIAQLLATIELQRSGDRLERSLIFLATGDEETGSELGTRWLLREHPELVGRFDAVITEGGVVEAVTTSDVKYWGTEFCQKRLVFVDFCDGSRERLEDLRSALIDHVVTYEASRQLSPTIELFLKRYAPSRDLGLFRELLSRPTDHLEGFEFYQLPPFAKALFKNELAVHPVEEDPEGGYRLTAVLHLLPDVELAQGWAELLPDALTWDIAVSAPFQPGPVGTSPLDHPVFRGIDAFMRREIPGLDHGPYVVPWSATDARFFRAAGIPSYGFSPFLILSTDTLQISGTNERMVLPAFVEGVDLYKRLVRELVGAE